MADNTTVRTDLKRERKRDPHLYHASAFASAESLTWSGSQYHLNHPAQHPEGTEAQYELEDGQRVVAPVGRVTIPLAVTAFISAFGNSFPHGWNTGVMNAPSRLIQDFLNESYIERTGSPPSYAVLNLLWSASVAVYLIGGCAGAFSAGWMANIFGRKKALIICNFFNFVAAILFGFCQLAMSFEMLIIARIVVGYGCGAGSGLVPMYLTEIAPVNIRGAMGVLHQFALTCGILVSQIFGLQQVLGSDFGWPILLALTAAPALFSCIVLPFCPESPRYLLIGANKEEEAEKALKRFRGTDDVALDLAEMKKENEQQKSEEKWTFKQLIKAKNLRLPLIIVCSLACCQQLSGINAVFYYSTGVFEESGIPPDKTQYAVLATGVINVLMTAISIPLMEKSGRRFLLLGGMILMILAAAVLTVSLATQHFLSFMSYFSIGSIILFVVGFAIGLGSIPQFIGAELFKQGPRPPAMSLAGFLNWLCNFIIGITFPTMQALLKSYSFIVFIFILLSFGIFLWFKLPETKNKSYDEIYLLFHQSAPEEEKTQNGTAFPYSGGKTLLEPTDNKDPESAILLEPTVQKLRKSEDY